ncbi:MAG: hypothetical protein JXR94_10855 [Candidatus Hydrogenedentes bacterium]|nr:hypothetical protein [Candidatus Hydrogenedentota bacterium]
MTQPKSQKLIFPLVVVLSAVITMACGLFTEIPILPFLSLANAAALALCIVVVSVAAWRPAPQGQERMLWAGPVALWLAFFAFAGINLASGLVETQAYGDHDAFLWLLDGGWILSKWFLGHVLIHFLIAIAQHAPPALKALWGVFDSPEALSKWLALIAMGASTIYLVRTRPGRLSVLFVLFTPVWIVFSVGYVEYYPFIAWIVPVLYLWILDRPLAERSPYAVGCIAAALPLTYIGYAPLGAILLVSFMVLNPRQAPRALAACVACALTLISVFYGKYPHEFVHDYFGSMATGDTLTAYSRYQGKAASDASVLFSPRYALSGGHLKDVFFMWFFGGGLASVLILAGALAAALARRPVGAALRREPRLWIGAAFVIWAALYMLFMIPKLGPGKDVDLFFVSYLTFAFFAGHLVDILAEACPQRPAVRLAVLAGFLGNTAVSTVYLVFFGVPGEVF